MFSRNFASKLILRTVPRVWVNKGLGKKKALQDFENFILDDLDNTFIDLNIEIGSYSDEEEDEGDEEDEEESTNV